MVNSPMVILWKDTDNGGTVLSQREATDYVMPTVVSSPSTIATPLNYRAVSTSTNQTLSFSVPSTTEARERVIWAW